MDLYHTSNQAEKMLQTKADIMKIPLGGSMELLPLCNMNCKMCYVRMTKEEMNGTGYSMLSCDEWLRIADEGIEQGMLFLLLTGGEPLLYPEFTRLYQELSKRGLILSLNTNGTLINEETAKLLSSFGCRRVNITLYGKDDETYGRLCSNPKGFSQVMEGAKLLKKYNVPFRFTCSLTPDNVEQLEELYEIARSFDVPLSVAAYMFPASRREVDADHQFRLSPEKAGEMIVKSYQLSNPEADMEVAARITLDKAQNPPRFAYCDGFACHAGKSGFWMNWKGELLPCGMFTDFKISLKEHSFKECWEYIVKKCSRVPTCSECKDCEKQNICQVCQANCFNETGSYTGKPEYMCRMTDAMIGGMSRFVNNDSNR